MKKVLFALTGVLGNLLLGACASSTHEIAAVSNFDPDRYLGKWYEIARLPHRFERGMDFVTAEYSRNEDGTIRVHNRGIRDKQVREVYGVAKLKDNPGTGELRVSFFRPFYGDYRIIFLTPDYRNAIVTSSTKDYLWILSRNPELPQDVLKEYQGKIAAWGFKTDLLEYPRQK